MKNKKLYEKHENQKFKLKEENISPFPAKLLN